MRAASNMEIFEPEVENDQAIVLPLAVLLLLLSDERAGQLIHLRYGKIDEATSW